MSLIRLTARFFTAAISKGKAEYIAKQFKLEPEQVEAIAQFDPSPTNVFTTWLSRAVRDGRTVESLEGLVEPLKKFIALKNNPDFPVDKKEIMKYTPEELLKLVGNDRRFRRNLSVTEIERKIMKEGLPGAEMIWNGGGFKMWEVTNPVYARFLSSNTSWCTAQVGYSQNYCSSGYLYPIYYHDEPLAQGHSYSDEEGTPTLLNKQDNDISLTDPTIIQMLQTINNEPMKRLRNLAITKSTLDRSGIFSWEEAAPFAEVCLKYKMVRPISYLTQKFYWPEGLELLLDYPAILPTAVPEDGRDLSKLVEEHPELAEEIVYELNRIQGGAAKNKMVRLLLILGDELPEGMDLELDSIASITGISTPSKTIEKILARAVEDIDYRNSDFEEFVSHNDWGYTDAVLAYWLKVVKTPMGFFDKKLKGIPQYDERCAIINAIPDTYSLGDIVELGPDYSGDLTGPVTIEKIVRRDKIFTVSCPDGRREDIEQDRRAGVFRLGKFLSKGEAKPFALSSTIKVLDPQPDIADLKMGDRVIPGPLWNFQTTGYQPKEGELGSIVTIDNEGSVEQFVHILWDHDPEQESRGGYWYQDNGTKRVLIVEIVPVPVKSEESALPLMLKTGLRVKRGPTWDWSDQDTDENGDQLEGIIQRGSLERGDGWVTVNWVGGSDNGYRYSYDEYAFYLDVVPVDFEFDEMTEMEIGDLQKSLLDKWHEEYPSGWPDED